MIPVSRAAVRRAIAQGKTPGGDWHLCQRDGAILWMPTWGPCAPGHSGHTSLRLPALFPEGEHSRYCYLCLWARKTPMAPGRREELFTLMLGTPSALNPTGDAYAASCIVRMFLTSDERACWNEYLEQRLQMLADTCLVALNDLSRRARFCYDGDEKNSCVFNSPSPAGTPRPTQA